MRIDSLIIKLIQYLIDKEKSEKKYNFSRFLTFQQGIFILHGHGPFLGSRGQSCIQRVSYGNTGLPLSNFNKTVD